VDESFSSSKFFRDSDQVPVRTAKILDNSRCDLESLKNYLRDCTESHERCPGSATHGRIPDAVQHPLQHPDNFRVIEVFNLQLIDAPIGCRYMALSYVWEKRASNQITRLTKTTITSFYQREGIPLSSLPQIIKDAIHVCRRIDEKYLWVDSLCIVQDDDFDKMAQISAMDTIYTMARATIVAACRDDPSQGLTCLRERSPSQLVSSVEGVRFITCATPINQILTNSLWWSRGWTYQEFVLSPRLVVFTSQQIFFCCYKEIKAEDTCYKIRGQPTRAVERNAACLGRMEDRWAEGNGIAVETIQRMYIRLLQQNTDLQE
jgi:hypothetical protein